MVRSGTQISNLNFDAIISENPIRKLNIKRESPKMMLIYLLLTHSKELLDDVQSVEMYSNFDLLLAVNLLLRDDDSKTFVDRATKRSLKSIVADFQKLKKELKIDDLIKNEIAVHKSSLYGFDVIEPNSLNRNKKKRKAVLSGIKNVNLSKNSNSPLSNGNLPHNGRLNGKNHTYYLNRNRNGSSDGKDNEERIQDESGGIEKVVSTLKEFIETNFYSPGYDLKPYPLKNFNPNPDFLNGIISPRLLSVAKKLHEKWKDLSRVRVELPINSTSTLLHLPYPFFIPGGRFREFYYWDTYWILEGLLISDLFESASNVVRNMSYVIGKLGYFPNGTRSYYQSRSQPPFFPHMLLKLLDVNGGYLNDFILNEGLENALKEYEFFRKYRTVSVDFDGEKHELSFFHVKTNFPRPESFSEDILTYEEYKQEAEVDSHGSHNKRSGDSSEGLLPSAHDSPDEKYNTQSGNGQGFDTLTNGSAPKRDNSDGPEELNPEDSNNLRINGMEHIMGNSSTRSTLNGFSSTKDDRDLETTSQNEYLAILEGPYEDSSASLLFSHLKTAAESGWDFSSRWLENDTSLKSIEAFYQIPVDLNAIMYRNELILAGLLKKKGDTQKSEEFLEKSKRRERAINSVLWNKKEKVWMDYVTTTKKYVDSRFYFSNITPLVYGIKVPDENINEYDILMKYQEELFGYDGGIPASGKRRKLTDIENFDSSSDSDDTNDIGVSNFDNNTTDTNNAQNFTNSAQNSAESRDMFSKHGNVHMLTSKPDNLDQLKLNFNDRNNERGAEHSEEGKDPSEQNKLDSGEESQQWDFPNAWAPHQHMLVEYLLHIGEKEMALNVARRFMASIITGFEQDGEFYEKYDATKLGNTGAGGEYEPQTGFGWTNGTALSFIKQFKDDLVVDYSHQEEYRKIQAKLRSKIMSHGIKGQKTGWLPETPISTTDDREYATENAQSGFLFRKS